MYMYMLHVHVHVHVVHVHVHVVHVHVHVLYMYMYMYMLYMYMYMCYTCTCTCTCCVVVVVVVVVLHRIIKPYMLNIQINPKKSPSLQSLPTLEHLGNTGHPMKHQLIEAARTRAHTRMAPTRAGRHLEASI